MMRKSANVFLAALAISGAAHAQTQWVRFGSDAQVVHYYDATRIQRDHYGISTYRAWWRTDFKTPHNYEGHAYSQELTLYRVNCDTNGIEQLQATGLDRKGIQAWAQYGAREQIAIPDSLGENFLQIVCGAAKEHHL